MLASDLLTLLNHAMNDDGNDTLTETRKLLALSEAMEVISTLDPGCYSVTENIDLVAGVLQTLPADGTRLLGLHYNTGAAGTTYGRTIKDTSKYRKDAVTVTWPETTGAVVSEYIYDPDMDPLSFLVIPQLSGPTKVLATYSKVPTAMTDAEDTFPLRDTYRTATIEFALYRIFTRDDVGTDNYRRGQGHYEKGLQLLGLKVNTDDRKDQELAQ